MNALDDLSNKLTIVMIAHRLSTVQRCDRVVKIEKGNVVAIGSPNDILRLT